MCWVCPSITTLRENNQLRLLPYGPALTLVRKPVDEDNKLFIYLQRRTCGRTHIP